MPCASTSTSALGMLWGVPPDKAVRAFHTDSGDGASGCVCVKPSFEVAWGHKPLADCGWLSSKPALAVGLAWGGCMHRLNAGIYG